MAQTKQEKEAAAAAKKRSEAAKKAAATRKANAEASQPEPAPTETPDTSERSDPPETTPTETTDTSERSDPTPANESPDNPDERPLADSQQAPEEIAENQAAPVEDQSAVEPYQPKRLELENAGLDQHAAEKQRQAELDEERQIHNERTSPSGFKY